MISSKLKKSIIYWLIHLKEKFKLHKGRNLNVKILWIIWIFTEEIKYLYIWIYSKALSSCIKQLFKVLVLNYQHVKKVQNLTKKTNKQLLLPDQMNFQKPQLSMKTNHLGTVAVALVWCAPGHGFNPNTANKTSQITLELAFTTSLTLPGPRIFARVGGTTKGPICSEENKRMRRGMWEMVTRRGQWARCKVS